MFELSASARAFFPLLSALLDSNTMPFSVDMKDDDPSFPGELVCVNMYPDGNTQDYIRLCRGDTRRGFVHVFLDGERACRVDPKEYGYNVPAMIEHGKSMVQYRQALYDVVDTINILKFSSLKHAHREEDALRLAVNAFLVHRCDEFFEGDGESRVYFTIKGETLPNDAVYFMDYDDSSWTGDSIGISADGKRVASLPVSGIGRAYLAEKKFVQSIAEEV